MKVEELIESLGLSKEIQVNVNPKTAEGQKLAMEMGLMEDKRKIDDLEDQIGRYENLLDVSVYQIRDLIDELYKLSNENEMLKNMMVKSYGCYTFGYNHLDPYYKGEADRENYKNYTQVVMRKIKEGE